MLGIFLQKFTPAAYNFTPRADLHRRVQQRHGPGALRCRDLFGRERAAGFAPRDCIRDPGSPWQFPGSMDDDERIRSRPADNWSVLGRPANHGYAAMGHGL